MSITVLKPGLQTTIQSRPRAGLRHVGVPASGAADPLSLALANKLVGNDWFVPALEATLLGPVLRFDVPCTFAFTGANATATLNGDAVACHETVAAKAGDILDLGSATKGARVYLAIPGGFPADEVLGSTSTYLTGGLGGFNGRALEESDVLPVSQLPVSSLRTPDEFRMPMASSWALRACASFETDQLDAADRQVLFDTNWVVGRRTDRMGLQIDGPRLHVSSEGRMPSAPVFPGTVQCPEHGSPFVLAVDAGTVGGYPRIAQIVRADRHLLGQLRPGDHVRLLKRETQSAIDELRAKLAYWRAWLDNIDEVI